MPPDRPVRDLHLPAGRMRILYAVCGWGLGHATRSLPVLRRLVREHDVFVYAEGAAAALLESELADARVRFLPAVPYPNIFGGALAFRFFARAPALLRAMRAEHAEAEVLVRTLGIDRVVSDSRWGVSSTRVPSLFISHHLRQLAPPGLRAAERLTERVTWRAIHGRYRRILVPDVAAGGGLSGRLAHGLRCYDPRQLRYVGPLSDVTPAPVPRDVDTLVVLGGPEPSRTRLEERLVPELVGLPGRTVVLRGLPAGGGPPWPLRDVEARPHARKPERDRLFSAARVVVGRSGYTTVMDVARVGARALFIPMRGQTEQEYLARRLDAAGLARGIPERRVRLARDVPIAAARKGLTGFGHPDRDPVSVALEEIVA
jgi:glycosyl transferase family 1/glycosyl transferase family 28